MGEQAPIFGEKLPSPFRPPLSSGSSRIRNIASVLDLLHANAVPLNSLRIAKRSHQQLISACCAGSEKLI